MKKEYVGSKKHFRMYLLLCGMITAPGIILGLLGVCELSYLLIFFYMILGFPWNFLIVPPLELILKNVPSLYESSGKVCLGPLDAFAMSIPIFINIGFIFVVMLFFFKSSENIDE